MQDPFELIHNNKIVIEEAHKKHQCSACGGLLFKKDIVAKNTINKNFQKLKYHLQCFRPIFETPIREEQILLVVTEPSNRIKIENWIKSWNWSLRSKIPAILANENKVPRKLLNMNIQKSPLSAIGKHNLINILLFLFVDEILYIMKFVSSDCYEITWDKHLWKRLCNRDFRKRNASRFQKTNKEITWNEAYFKLQKVICYVCKRDNRDDLKHCPIEKKPICKTCRQHSDFKLLSLSDIKKKYGEILWHIFDNFIDKYARTCFGDKVFYKKDVENAFKSFQNFQNNSI